MKLNLKGFKYIGSDDKSTTMQHDDGHEIKVAHNVLSKSAKSQLDELRKAKDDKKKDEYGKITDPKGEKPQVYAEGGGVLQYLDDAADRISGQKKPEKASQEGTVPTQKRIPAKPGAKQDIYSSYADGGNVEDATKFDVNKVPEITPEAEYAGAIERNQIPGADPRAVEFLAGADTLNKQEQKENLENSELAKADSIAADTKAKEEMAAEELAQKNALRQSTGLQPIAGQQAEQPQEQQGLAADIQPQQPTKTVMATPQQLMTAADAAQSQGVQAQIDAEKLRAKALAAQGDAESKALELNQSAQMEARAAFQKAQNEILQTGKQYEQDVKNGYIDPNKYWTGYTLPNGQKVEGHSKLTATIGMLIAGFGGNNAVKMLDDQIDKSLDAQKQNLQSSHNLLRANMDKYKNIQDAYSVTRMQLQDDVMNRLQHAAAKAKSPLAQAAAQSAIGELQQKQQAQAQQLAMTRALSNVNANTPEGTKAVGMVLDQMSLTNPERAKEYKDKFVPGVGFAGTSEGAKGVREMKTTTETVKQGLQRLKDIAKRPGKSLSLTDRAEAEAVRRVLVGRLREPITGPGSMSDGEREMLLGLIPDVASTFSIDSVNQKKLDTLEKSVVGGYNNMLRANGLTPAQPAINTSNLEGKTATGSNGQRIIFKSGKWQPLK